MKFNEISLLERTAEKLRYLRLSSSHRKSRSKRNSQASPTPNLLQSPVLSEGRSSTSSASNATGNEGKSDGVRPERCFSLFLQAVI